MGIGGWFGSNSITARPTTLLDARNSAGQTVAFELR